MRTLALLTQQLSRALLTLGALGAMFWLLYSYPAFLIVGVVLFLWMISKVERSGLLSTGLPSPVGNTTPPKVGTRSHASRAGPRGVALVAAMGWMAFAGVLYHDHFQRHLVPRAVQSSQTCCSSPGKTYDRGETMARAGDRAGVVVLRPVTHAMTFSHYGSGPTANVAANTHRNAALTRPSRQVVARDHAIAWIEKHIPPGSYMITDQSIRTDLLARRHNGVGVYRHAEYYWRVEHDPAIRLKIFHNHWRTVDYVVATPQLLTDVREMHMGFVGTALAHSTVVAQFDAGGWPIEIYRVAKNDTCHARGLDTSLFSETSQPYAPVVPVLEKALVRMGVRGC